MDTTVTTEDKKEDKKVEEPSHTPETDKDKKPERTPKEIAAFNLKKHAEELRKLGGSPEEVLIRPKIEVQDEIPDDTPLTAGLLREMNRKEAKKSALQMADAIEDEHERARTKDILGRLTPSGNAEDDFNLAYSAVNAKRAQQISEDISRSRVVKRTAPGSSVSTTTEEPFEPDAEEVSFMERFNLTKEDILKARKERERNRK